MTRPPANPSITPSIILADDSLLVVDKPAGLVVEPGLGHARDSLLNGLMSTHGEALAALGPDRDWGLVHRLDRETGGCVLIALTAAAYDHLRRQFESRSVRKSYLSIVNGRLPNEQGTIDDPLVETRRGDMKISVPGRRGAGRPAVTHFRVLAATRSRSLLLVRIETGRLHQIRAHLASIGHPVCGDRVYRSDLPPNTSRPGPGRARSPLLLHAWRLEFSHPVTGRRTSVESPPPACMREAIRELAGRPCEAVLPAEERS